MRYSQKTSTWKSENRNGKSTTKKSTMTSIEVTLKVEKLKNHHTKTSGHMNMPFKRTLIADLFSDVNFILAVENYMKIHDVPSFFCSSLFGLHSCFNIFEWKLFVQFRKMSFAIYELLAWRNRSHDEKLKCQKRK